jgi:apolipoprotein N-acyltransferase
MAAKQIEERDPFDIRNAPVQRVQFHVGVTLAGTVLTGFDVDHMKTQRHMTISANVVGPGILVAANGKRKLVPFANIKEADLVD